MNELYLGEMIKWVQINCISYNSLFELALIIKDKFKVNVSIDSLRNFFNEMYEEESYIPSLEQQIYQGYGSGYNFAN